MRVKSGVTTMNLFFAACALLIAGVAHALAMNENEKGHYWSGLISGLLAMGTAWTSGFVLLGTDIAPGVYFIGVFVSLRIALEVGLSFSAIICPPGLE